MIRAALLLLIATASAIADENTVVYDEAFFAQYPNAVSILDEEMYGRSRTRHLLSRDAIGSDISGRRFSTFVDSRERVSSPQS